MKDRKLVPLQAAVPGLLVLFSMRPPSALVPWMPYGAALGWLVLAALVSYRRKWVPDWCVPAFGLVFPALGILAWFVGYALSSTIDTSEVNEVLWIAMEGVPIAAGVGAAIFWGRRLVERKRLLPAAYTSLGVLAISLMLDLASAWAFSSQWNMTRSAARLLVGSVLYFLVLLLGMASLALLFVLIAWYLAPDRPHLAIGLVGVAGFFLWTFWLEFDYGMPGTGYAYLMGAWFAFWLMVVLPAISVGGLARRHPLALMTGILLIAFGGSATMEALVRVRPDALSGVLSLVRLPANPRGSVVAGVGGWAGEPLIRVMLGFLAEYLPIAVTAVAAYVFATGGRFDGVEDELLQGGFSWPKGEFSSLFDRPGRDTWNPRESFVFERK